MYFVDGWIEVRSGLHGPWRAVIRLGGLDFGSCRIAYELFGVGRSAYPDGVFSGRKVPTDASFVVQAEVESWDDPGAIKSTWATLAEIDRSAGDILVGDDFNRSNWWLAFQLANTLGMRFGTSNVRFVVWGYTF